ncbi:uncharacterized protein LOC117102304 [Anneissia japonica]|uniref:uncharacterized protein LOC117102304 n=1 Tax=Anneissia japonica TaxID=1529436 RepID=UPI00142560B8|nr:uncharacterized protein LOC117102304 [Anneissia japonica]
MAEGGNGAASEGISGLDSFFVKQRRDLMYEIRKLKYGDKPVTEGESKEKIEKFFVKCLQSDEYPDESTSRPENVLLDIGDLFESRPVSNLLRSMQFREELEGVVRGTVNRQEQEMERAQRLRVAGLAMAAAAAEHFSPVETLSEASASISSQPSVDSRLGFIPPPPPFMPNNTPQTGQPFPSPNPFGTSNGFAAQNIGSTQQNQFAAWQQFQMQQFLQWQQLQQPHQQWQQPHQPWQQPWQQPQQQPQQLRGNRPASQQQPNSLPQPPLASGVLSQRPWLTRRENPQNMNQPPVVNLDQNRREEFIADISDLVQQQLVSSTLESNFRGRLEYLLGDRLTSAGFDGQRVSEFVQSLRPTRRILRNDFRHLGINAPRPQDNRQSREETTLPSLEFESLRRQMDELKNMVQLTFDLQMDMQRAIRQEVAAALTGHSGPGTLPQNATQPANEGHCLICLEKSIDSVLYQCGHMCVCLCCGLKLKSQGNNCPMCRAPIRDVIRAYRCHDE